MVQKLSNLAQITLKWVQCVAYTVTKTYENEENILMKSYRHWNGDDAQIFVRAKQETCSSKASKMQAH